MVKLSLKNHDNSIGNSSACLLGAIYNTIAVLRDDVINSSIILQVMFMYDIFTWKNFGHRGVSHCMKSILHV